VKTALASGDYEEEKEKEEEVLAKIIKKFERTFVNFLFRGICKIIYFSSVIVRYKRKT
jgi:hypothetical protein